MAAMGRGLSHAATADKEGAAMTLRTITPPITAGRGRAAPAARYIKPAVAPPLPVRARTRGGRRVGERVPFPRTLLPAQRSFLARTSVSEAGVRAPYGKRLGSNVGKRLGNAGKAQERSKPTATGSNQT